MTMVWLNFQTQTVALGNHFGTFGAQCKKPHPSRSSRSRNTFFWMTPYIKSYFSCPIFQGYSHHMGMGDGCGGITIRSNQNQFVQIFVVKALSSYGHSIVF